MFLNRRDASRYRDLETFLPGLETFLNPYNLDILLNKSIYLVILANYNYNVVYRDSSQQNCLQPGLETQKVEKQCYIWLQIKTL